MQTPLQMLIEKLGSCALGPHSEFHEGIDYAIELAEQFLEEEKMQIKRAYFCADTQAKSFDEAFERAEDYFTETFR